MSLQTDEPVFDAEARTATAEGESAKSACPLCGLKRTEVFFAMRSLPVHGQAVCVTRQEALDLARGDQVLAVCHGCGFVFNTVFDPGRLDYSGRHEESQAFSPAFRTFANELAQGWVRRHRLEGELVIEIGCGKGDFLNLLADAGVGRAHGVDPGIELDRLPAGGRVTGEKAYFAASELTRAAAAVVCRHTLEHIPNVSEFLTDVVEGIDRRRCRALLFEVPGLSRILEEGAFWDLQYEHCSSFTAGSLQHAFERLGVDVVDLRLVYNGQYLVIEADPMPGRSSDRPSAPRLEVEEIVAGCRAFADAVEERIAGWRDWFTDQRTAGREVVVWGGGAKGVVFLNRMGEQAVRRVVDINKGLHGNFLAGVGVPIIAPAELREDPPDVVLLMNEVYLSEVRQMLDELGLGRVELRAV